jgi:hypothetical protein
MTGFYFFATASRLALGPNQPPIQEVPGAIIQGRQFDHSTPSSAEVKECVELYLHSPVRLHGVVISLEKAKGNFYLYL